MACGASRQGTGMPGRRPAQKIRGNFMRFPPLDQRVRMDAVQIKKKQPELFSRRLQKFLRFAQANVMYGEWNDNGRLCDGEPR